MAMVVFLSVAVTAAVMVLVSGGDDRSSFVFNGFRSANLTMDGLASVTSNGLLQLTNQTKHHMGHAFYPYPLAFTNSSSFSTTFVFAIRPLYPLTILSGHGLAFVISPTKAFPSALPANYLGLVNNTNNGNPRNHVFAVELDTIQSTEFGDINDNHVGIDINSLSSANSTPAGYYVDGSKFQNLSLISGHLIQVWVDYDGGNKQISVTLGPVNVNKPKTPLLTLSQDLSHVLKNLSYVGFSSSAGSFLTSHYVLGWSFKLNGEAQNLVFSQLPKLPRLGGRKQSLALLIGLPLLSLCFIFPVIVSIVYCLCFHSAFTM